MIKVLKPGFYSTIQDFGRTAMQHYGVPCAGVMDRQSAALANSLLGNKIDDAVIEMTMTGATLLFEKTTAFTVTGACMSPTLNGVAIPLNKVIIVKPKDVLSFGKLVNGFRAYIAIYGGFKTDKVMGSRSMFQGVTLDCVLNKNDVLKTEVFFTNNNTKNAKLISGFNFAINTLDVYKGPEFNSLNTQQKKRLFNHEFVVSKNHSRMGYQLIGFSANNLKPIITSIVQAGTVQLTPAGTLIVLMRDCQTTGGYPRVLQLSRNAVNVLGQKHTGENLSFNLITF